MFKLKMKKKRLFLLLMLLTMVCIEFVSCADNDEEIDSELVGTWQYVGIENQVDNSFEKSETDEYIQFKANGTGADYRKENGTWVVESFSYQYQPGGIVLSRKYTSDQGQKVNQILVTATELKFFFAAVATRLFVYKKVDDSVLNGIK